MIARRNYHQFFGARRVVSQAGIPPHIPATPWRPVRAPYDARRKASGKVESMKAVALFSLICAALAVSSCSSNKSQQATSRAPVWILPAPPATPTASSNTLPTVATTPAAVAAAPANASVPAIQTNTPPPVANVLKLADIREMAAKGVSEQTILNMLRTSRAIYTLTTQDVTELQEAKVSRAVTDYLLSTPLLYKDDLLRSRAYYYYAPLYPGYWHWSFHDVHHDVHHYGSHYSYGHDSHHGGLHH